MSDADPEKLLALARDVALEAGQMVVERRRGLVEVAATKSSPTDVVTQVDLASEELIRSRLGASRAQDGFLGEEGAEVAGTSGVTWVVDPIDGTVNFLYNIPQYAVSLAARDGDEVVAGVVHNPVSNETFTAVRGHGAFLGDVPVHVSACRDLSFALVGTGYHYRRDVRSAQAEETARLVRRVRDIRRFGSAALDLCAVACGRLDAYVERGLHPWDLAAGALIAAEAGARVSGLGAEPAGQRLTVAAPEALFAPFQGALTEAGFGAWPLPDWP